MSECSRGLGRQIKITDSRLPYGPGAAAARSLAQPAVDSPGQARRLSSVPGVAGAAPRKTIIKGGKESDIGDVKASVNTSDGTPGPLWFE